MTEVENHYATDGPGLPGRHRRPDYDRPKGRETLVTKAAHVVEGARGGVRDAAAWSRDRYGDAAEWVVDSADGVARNATYAGRRSAAEFNRGRRTIESFVEENPIMVGVVGLAAGLLAGALLPGTRRENQYLGPYADEIREQGLRYAHEVAEQGRTLVEENLGRLSQMRVDRDTGDETSAGR